MEYRQPPGLVIFIFIIFWSDERIVEISILWFEIIQICVSQQNYIWSFAGAVQTAGIIRLIRSQICATKSRRIKQIVRNAFSLS